jgi:hypothetical protein
MDVSIVELRAVVGDIGVCVSQETAKRVRLEGLELSYIEPLALLKVRKVLQGWSPPEACFPDRVKEMPVCESVEIHG